MDLERDVVVEVRECNAVLSAYWLTNDNLVDVIEFIPVFVSAHSQTRRSHGQTRHNLKYFPKAS